MDPTELPPHVEAVIGYEHRYRKVYVTSVWESKAGNTCLTAWDPDAEDGEGGWRCFRADRLNGKIHLVN